MAKLKKKGVSGNAKNFITRTQAVKKLQISLPDFRRLCIFKGIYPREPRNKKKANKGSTAPTTFYYTKDIQYLLHEPVLQKFREHKTFAKRLQKALGRGDYGDAKRLEQTQKPRVKLDHIVKERYPSFTDALRDLDDALSMLFLFANLPSNQDIPPQTIATCERLCNEFQHYVIRTHGLRKSFLSIKGIYYEAEIHGQNVLWLVPYKFAQNVPIDVDFRIMLTFIDFYTTLIGFVLYRLYTMEGLVYPPKFNKELDDKAAGLKAFSIETRGIPAIEQSKASTTEKDIRKQLATLDQTIASLEDQEDPEEPAVEAQEDVVENTEGMDTFVPATNDESADILQQPAAINGQVGADASQLFSKFTFYLSRETPRQPLEFLLRSFGCKRIGWDAVLGDGSFTESDRDSSITHHVIDRPPVMGAPDKVEDVDMEGTDDKPVLNGRIPGRIYVQPQYIWDCVNAGRLLRPDSYAQGAELPPHLSPWVKPKDGEYDPSAPLPETEDFGESDEEEEEVGALEDEVEGETLPDKDEEWGGMDTELAESSNDEEDDDDDTNPHPTKPAAISDDDSDSDVSDTELAQRELEAEAAGIPLSEITNKAKSKKQKAASEATKRKQAEKEEMERAKMMMTKKKRKLYEKMIYSNQKKADEVDKLVTKRRKLEKEKDKKKVKA